MGPGARNRGHEPTVQLVRLRHVLVLPDIRVPVHAGHRHIGVLVRGVRQHGVRQPGPHVHGGPAVHLLGRHDRRPERAVPAPAARHRHGHPPADRSGSRPAARQRRE